MTVKDVISQTEFINVYKEMIYFYGQIDLRKLYNIYQQLNNITPKANITNMQIFIRVLRENEQGIDVVINEFDLSDKELMFDVCGENDEFDGLYSIASSDFSELVGFHIKSETIDKFPYEQIIAHLLWELEW